MFITLVKEGDFEGFRTIVEMGEQCAKHKNPTSSLVSILEWVVRQNGNRAILFNTSYSKMIRGSGLHENGRIFGWGAAMCFV